MKQLLLGEGKAGGVLRLGDGQAVKADLDLDDFGHAVLGAIFEFALLDAARSVGEVGGIFAHTGAEQLHAAAGAGRFDDRGLHAAGLAEGFGNGVVKG